MGKQIVLGIFPDEAAADTAAETLKEWDDLDGDLRVNAIGVLVLGDDGKIKTHKLGRRSWGAGAGIGLVLAALTPVTLVGGVLAGTAIGALHHKGLGIDDAERDVIERELKNGRAAVGALAEDDQATKVSVKLTELGGEIHVLRPTDEGVAEVDGVAPEVEAAETAASGPDSDVVNKAMGGFEGRGA